MPNRQAGEVVGFILGPDMTLSERPLKAEGHVLSAEADKEGVPAWPLQDGRRIGRTIVRKARLGAEIVPYVIASTLILHHPNLPGQPGHAPNEANMKAGFSDRVARSNTMTRDERPDLSSRRQIASYVLAGLLIAYIAWPTIFG